MYSYEFTRDISKSLYEEIMVIREEHYYGNIFDPRYWQGGIVGLLNAEKIEKSHLEDATSLFMLIYDNQKKLVSYARFSVNFFDNGLNKISKLHIFICKKIFISKKIEIFDEEELKEIKLGNFMLTKIIEHCKTLSSTMLISEIAVFPYPNLPSLILHKNVGFVSMSKSLKTLVTDVGNVEFVVLAKSLCSQEIDYVSLPEEL